MEEEKSFITLRCYDCENTNCAISRKWIHPDSKEGCTRELSEDDMIKYYHYINEIMPFLYVNTSKSYQNEEYHAFMDLLDSIYSAPLGQRIKDRRKLP